MLLTESCLRKVAEELEVLTARVALPSSCCVAGRRVGDGGDDDMDDREDEGEVEEGKEEWGGDGERVEGSRVKCVRQLRTRLQT